MEHGPMNISVEVVIAMPSLGNEYTIKKLKEESWSILIRKIGEINWRVCTIWLSTGMHLDQVLSHYCMGRWAGVMSDIANELRVKYRCIPLDGVNYSHRLESYDPAHITIPFTESMLAQ